MKSYTTKARAFIRKEKYKYAPNLTFEERGIGFELGVLAFAKSLDKEEREEKRVKCYFCRK